MTIVKVIAAIECNHGGSIRTAEEMIRLSKKSSADYVKFQFFHPHELGVTPELAKKLDKVKFDLKQLKHLKEYSEKEGIQFLCTPMKTIKTLHAYVNAIHPSMIKIREADGRNDEFVDAAAATGLPLLISIDPKKGPFFKPPKTTTYLMYCNPRYPPRTADFNHDSASSFEGFSSHFPHTTFCKVAVREARTQHAPIYWLETHVTFSHDYDCLDKKVSIDFNELAEVSSYAHRSR